MNNKDYTIFVISNKPHKFPSIVKSLEPERVNYFDGTGYDSFARLVNSCIEMSPTETVIILSDKVLPKTAHIQKIIKLLNDGYALVGLYRFACFGLKKELVRRIGMLDERFVGGGFEDYDLVARMIEADTAFYITEEVPYTSAPSSWDYSKAYHHWCSKWKHTWQEGNQIPVKIEKVIEEEYYDYKLGAPVSCEFLSSLDHTHTCDSPHVAPFLKMNIDIKRK